mgnify:FL=1
MKCILTFLASMILAHSKSELYIVDSDRDHIALEFDGKSAV